MPFQLELGSVRQAWMAPLTTPSSKSSFLTRDDAFTETTVSVARQIKLGDNIGLGPNDFWQQVSWEGGQDQTKWHDAAMYKSGNCDTTRQRGKAKLWSGYEIIGENASRVHWGYKCASGDSGTGVDTPLWMCEYDPINAGISNTDIYTFAPTTGAVTLDHTITGAKGIMDLCPIRQSVGGPQSGMAFLGFNGHVYTRDGSGVWADEFSAGLASGLNGLATFSNNLYFGSSLPCAVYKRNVTGTAVAWAKAFDVPNDVAIAGLCTHQNRLWFGGVRFGGYTTIYVSDGVTMTTAFEIPEWFTITAMVSHFGSLYIAGYRQSAKWANGLVGVVWRYNGSTLQKIYTEGTGFDAEYHYILDIGTWGRYVAWPHGGYSSNGFKPGVMLYDPELDALVSGPTMDMDTANGSVQAHGTSIANYMDTIVVSFKDTKTGYPAGGVTQPSIVARVKPVEDQVRHSRIGGAITAGLLAGQSFEAYKSTREDFLLSSVYDADTPLETKTWLGVRVWCKVPQNSQIQVRVILNESGTETALPTITYNGSTAWRQVSIAAKDGSGNYLQSQRIQYKFYFQNTDSTAGNSVANPYIDSVYLSFQPKPVYRRSWRLRILCSDGQNRLDGSSNPITTTQALIDGLKSFANGGTPFLFWDTGSDPATPVTSGTEVSIQDINIQRWRLDNVDQNEEAEVSLTLVEVIP